MRTLQGLTYFLVTAPNGQTSGANLKIPILSCARDLDYCKFINVHGD